MQELENKGLLFLILNLVILIFELKVVILQAK